MNPVRHFLHTTLLLLVLGNAGHIHSHVCLEGQAPSNVVHFENLGGHPGHHDHDHHDSHDQHVDAEHSGDSDHVDIAKELLPQVMLPKTLDQDAPLFALAPSVVLAERLPMQRPWYLAIDARDRYLQPEHLIPPSRGPPAHSA